MSAAVGRDVDRLDGPLKVSGGAQYAPETPVSNAGYAVIVGSTVAAGRIAAIDRAAAEGAPGVWLVLTHENAPRLRGREHEEGERVLQLLQDDRVVYNDQPVAVVVADTLERAQHAARLVSVQYQTAGAPNVDIAAERSAPYAPERTARGPADWHKGDADAALAAAAARVDETYSTPTENHNPMEPHGTIAVWRGDDHLTLYDSTQGVFSVRRRLAALFGLKTSNVRVISLFIGGAFGCKGTAWSHVALAALAARAAGRPVRLSLTRHQMFSLVGHRPVTRQHLVLGADRQGRLLTVRHDVTSVTSRFDEFVEAAAGQTRMLYACPNIATSHRLIRLDIPTPTFTRAPGEASGSYALESAMDELAVALEIDPLELRLRNYAETDPETGHPFSSKSLRACYQMGAARFGWQRRSPKPRSMHDGRYLIGWGMATATYPASQGVASATVRVRADGTAVVQTGSQDIGTGTYTILAQIAADELGLPVERVSVQLGDTQLPEAPLSAGSRTASTVGPAVKGAAAAARAKLIALASARGQAAPADGFADLLKSAGQEEIAGQYHSQEKPERKNFAHHAFGAQFAEVRVDEDLGEIRVTRLVGAFACGKILNPKTARNQLMGGMVWGIGMALLEETRRDHRTGRVVTRDLADYHLPVNRDVPAIGVITVDEEDPHVNDLGAKGLGEIGNTGIAAAIANAVYHATGTRVRDLPITLDKLL